MLSPKADLQNEVFPKSGLVHIFSYNVQGKFAYRETGKRNVDSGRTLQTLHVLPTTFIQHLTEREYETAEMQL